MQILKQKQQYISDLDIKWNFTSRPYDSFSQFRIDFNSKNLKTINHILICPRIYNFKIWIPKYGNFEFKINTKLSLEFSELAESVIKTPYSVRTLMFVIDMIIRKFLQYKNTCVPIRLLSFYHISRNKFEILIYDENDDID